MDEGRAVVSEVSEIGGGVYKMKIDKEMLKLKSEQKRGRNKP